MDPIKRLLNRTETPAQPVHRCSGAMSAKHDGTDEAEYKGHLGRIYTFCGPCADAAGRYGMIDRRETPR